MRRLCFSLPPSLGLLCFSFFFVSACAPKKAPENYPSNLSSRALSKPARCEGKETISLLKTHWKSFLEKREAKWKKDAKALDPFAYYNMPGWTLNLILLEERCDLDLFLTDLSRLYQVGIDEAKKYGFYFMWLDENKNEMGRLYASQFLYSATRLAKVIAQKKEADRSPVEIKYLREAPPKIWNILHRWIFEAGHFQVHGWGCSGNEDFAHLRDKKHYFSHQNFLRLKLTRHFNKLSTDRGYCSAVTDIDLWIFGASLELGALAKLSDDYLAISEKNWEDLKDYWEISYELVESRLQKTELIGFDGRRYEGLIFEPDVWSEHPEYRYSGYTDELKRSAPNIKRNLSWDISHARRFVAVFDSMYHQKDLAGARFPSKKVLRHFANQYAYAMFKGEWDKPLFNNFIGGWDGWYKVSDEGGIGPSKLSLAGVTGGFGFWSEFNPEIDLINQRLWELAQSDDAKDQALLDRYYRDNLAENPTDMIQFLPVLIY